LTYPQLVEIHINPDALLRIAQGRLSTALMILVSLKAAKLEFSVKYISGEYNLYKPFLSLAKCRGCIPFNNLSLSNIPGSLRGSKDERPQSSALSFLGFIPEAIFPPTHYRLIPTSTFSQGPWYGLTQPGPSA
jgi:hypothetical protein